MYACMYVCMHVCMYVCMYVAIRRYVFTAYAHTFNVDDHFHLEMIVNINVIIGDMGLADRK